MTKHREQQSRAGEQRSESSGSLLAALLTLAAIPVGWMAYVYSVLVVGNHLLKTGLSPAVLGLSVETTFWLGVGVLVVVGFAMLVRPALLLTSWFVIAVLLAAGAHFVFGWTVLVLVVEGITLAPIVLAVLIGLESTAESSSASDRYLLRYLMARRRWRWRWGRW